MINSKLVITVPKVILSILWDIGSGTVKAFFPHPYCHIFCQHKKRTNFDSSLYQLKKRGLIKREHHVYQLTPLGKEKAFFAHLETTLKTIDKQPKKWDGFWRIIIFDIPEKKRNIRDEFRGILKILNFKELQKSTWVSPYTVPAIVNEMISNGHIERHTRIITVKEMNYDDDLKKRFNLELA